MSTVHVVDDDPDIRDLLENLCETVGLSTRAYSGAQEFLDDYSEGAPGCLIVDVRMPYVSGLDLLDRLCDRGATIPTIVVTAHGDVPTAVRAMKSGAFDFIEKPFSNQSILEHIKRALEEDRARHRVAEGKDRTAQRLSTLTRREREVLDKVIAVLPSKAIAVALGISRKTVEVHRANIMRKIEASGVADLVRTVVTHELASG